MPNARMTQRDVILGVGRATLDGRLHELDKPAFQLVAVLK
jgi:hypothetical protein